MEELKKEGDEMKTYVLKVSNHASAHRETLQQSYDEKITQIKDVCA